MCDDGVVRVQVPERLRAAGCRAWTIRDGDRVTVCVDETYTAAQADDAHARLRDERARVRPVDDPRP